VPVLVAVIQDALLEEIQVQPVAVVTLTFPETPAEPTGALAGEIA
jgi:hypothetical protein